MTGFVAVFVGVLGALIAALLFSVLWHRRALRWQPPTFDVRSEVLSVRVGGSGAPTLVFLHGLAGSGRYFGRAFEALGEAHRVVVPDLLGFGHSPRGAGLDYSLDAHCEAMEQTLDALGVVGPVWYVGHSTGCALAVELSLRRPAAGLVLIAPAIYSSEAVAQAQLQAMGWVVKTLAFDTPLARALCGWMCRHRKAARALAPLLRPSLPVPIARDGVLHSWRSYSGTLANVVVGSGAGVKIGALSIPIHIVVGDADRVVQRTLLEDLDHRMPNLELHRWPGGHDVPLTSPERCVDLVLTRSAQS